jgi:hypothetical protein
MSLTVSLALLGGALFVALAAHLWWKTRHASPLYRPFANTVARQSPEQRLEPTLGDTGDAGTEGGTGSESAEHASGRAEAALGLPRSRKPPPLDALIDALASISLENPISGDMALAHMPSSRRAGTKPMMIEGLDTETGQWQLPEHGRRYSAFQAGVQLANRSGALNEIEYSEFVHKVQAFAEGVGGMADVPDMLEVVARARELDGFASSADAQLSLLLQAKGPAWSVPYVQHAAARHGFVPGALPGRLVLPGAHEGDPPLLVLSFDPQTALAEDPGAAVTQVQLQLDVAQTPESSEPFPAWHRTATALCDEMGATAVDEQGVPITLQAFDGIGRELNQLYRRLESRELAAGSVAARRLFS